MILIAASMLKAHQLITVPIVTEGFWESWLFLVIQVPLELSLGIWLVSGLFRKAGWILAVMCFAGFIIVTLYKALAGEVSCGCFGRVDVNPWITLWFVDILFFVLLVLFRPVRCKLLPPPWPSTKHFFAVVLPSAVIIAALVPTLIFNKPDHIQPDVNNWLNNPNIQPNNTVDPNHTDTGTNQDANEITDPNYTLTQNTQTNDVNSSSTEDPNQKTSVDNASQQSDWEMYQFIDVAEALKQGIVVVVFYHNECDTCEEAIPYYDQKARDFGTGDDSIKFAFIEIPPYAPKEKSIVPPDTPVITGQLTESKLWHFESPQVALLIESSVIQVWDPGVAPTYEQIINAAFQ